MASNQATAPKAPPLSFMQSLSPAVSLYDPSAEATTDRRPDDHRDHPRLILVLSWMAAQDAHIAKYIAQHRVLFPSSRILLVRCPVDHFMWPPGREGQLQCALPVLREMMSSSSPDAVDLEERNKDTERKKPSLLIHVFSNGGVSTVAKLLEMLGAAYRFPRHVMLLDSCPGYFHWMSTHLALSQALPFWASPLVHLFMALSYVFRLGKEAPPDANARVLNADERLRATGGQVGRTYLYGDGDVMVDWVDVEDHGRRAESVGVRVRREKFEGGKHCAHVRVDGERYWRAVRESWEDGRE